MYTYTFISSYVIYIYACIYGSGLKKHSSSSAACLEKRRWLQTWSVLLIRCLLSGIRTIYSVSTLGVYSACFYFQWRLKCLLSVVRTIYSVSTFGVYFACFYFPSSVEIEVSTFRGPYYRPRDQPNPSLGNQSLVLKMYI